MAAPIVATANLESGTGRTPGRLVTRLLLAGLVAFAGTACSRTTNNQGYIIDPELIASVQPGVDNKQSVEKTLGRPTMVATWDDNSWYYISRLTKQMAYLRPSTADQTMLIVHFTPDGTVREVERRGVDQVVDIRPNRDRTETMGRESGILADLFGNIGQVGAGGP